MRELVIMVVVCLVMAAACVNAKYPTPTPRPLPMLTGMTADATEEAQGNITEGDRLFHTFQPAAGMACTTCHLTDSDNRLVGPGLKTVGIRAQTQAEGQSASEYIRTSIVDPSAYVVDGYLDMMPKNWGRVFSEAQLNDIVAYLISLSQ